MPILQSVEHGAPLRQGDLLKGVPLTAIGADGTPMDIEGLALIVSRDCATLHRENIMVARVATLKLELPKFEDELENPFDVGRHFLDNQLRRGTEQPDRFYLGEIPNQPNTRHIVHLDSLHVVNRMFAQSKNVTRVAGLEASFRRDLQVRLVQTFSRTGFDDHTWYSDADLRYLVGAGKTQLGILTKEVGEATTKLEIAHAQQGKTKHIEGLEERLKKCQQKVEDFSTTLAPYIQEMKNRGLWC